AVLAGRDRPAGARIRRRPPAPDLSGGPGMTDLMETPFRRSASLRAERGSAAALRSKTRGAARHALAVVLLLLAAPAPAQPPATPPPPRPFGAAPPLSPLLTQLAGRQPNAAPQD